MNKLRLFWQNWKNILKIAEITIQRKDEQILKFSKLTKETKTE